MRIIAGKLRRRQLSAPRGQLTRPTSDRTRESLFNLIEARRSLEEATVLDLFAGTGSLGLEAISRGASLVTFVEHQDAVLKYARMNAQALDVETQGRFLRANAVAFIERYRGPKLDLILADPPYDLPELARLPEMAIPHLSPDGYFVLEHDVRHNFSGHPHLDTSRSYGRTIVTVFAAEPTES
jgi:16S rRNA (guanine966-N2)-methyltransferase